jgi:hypothetical protein
MARQTQSLDKIDTITKIVVAIIGAVVAIVGAVVGIATYYKSPATPSGQTLTQSGIGNNQAGRDIIINPPVQHSPITDDAIYQAGVAVGKVYGGRRTPTDATLFEFQEITNASQFNMSAEFEYQGYTLKTVSVRTHVGFTSLRPQDGAILTGLLAKVVRQK